MIFGLVGDPPPMFVGPEFDDVAVAKPKQTLAERFASASPGSTAVVATVRDEGLLLLQWVAHYSVIGFDRLFVYTHDNSDGSDALLLALHKAGRITLINSSKPLEPSKSPQWKAYRHALWFVPELTQYEWVALLDADEFLMPVENGRVVAIQSLIDRAAGSGADAIALNWKWFAGDRSFLRTSGLVFDRFRVSGPDRHVKSLARPAAITDAFIHGPVMREGKLIMDGSGGLHQQAQGNTYIEPPATEIGQINHYWQQSFQEFCIKKLRGRTSRVNQTLEFDTFFKWGNKTPTHDPIPDDGHVAAVRAEIERLRGLPGVRQAERSVEAHFAAMDWDLYRSIYDDLASQFA
jgi:hypothetical protein